MLKAIKIAGITALLSLLLMNGWAIAESGAKTRQTIDSLQCEDLARGTWYRIEVNTMRGTYSGKEQALLELVEKRPGFSAQRATVFAEKMPELLYEHKGEREFQLFTQRAGEKGLIEAFAIVSEDGKMIEKVRLHIVPNGGEEASKEIDVASIWKE